MFSSLYTSKTLFQSSQTEPRKPKSHQIMAPKSLSNPRSSKHKEILGRPTYSEERGDEQESDDEEVEKDSSGEENEDSSEEDQEKEPEILPKSTDQENGSDSEPESDDSPSAYKMEPIPKTSVTASKRKNQEIGNGDNSSKSNKRTKAEENKSYSIVSLTPGGGGCITRLWSDDDEIALLNGMVDFKKSKNTDFGGAFYETIKGKLQVDFSREQLRTKISRIKKRFLNALRKGQNGLDPVFSKPHDVMAFELSKKIWGGETGNKNDSGGGVEETSKKDTIKEKKLVWDEEEIVKNEDDEGSMWSKYKFFSSSFDNLVGKFPSLGMSDSGLSLVKEKLSFIGNAKAKELNEKWKQMLVDETELHYRMLSLMREQIKLALDQ